MATHYKLIPQIAISETNWSAKVVITGKQSPKTARNSSTRYQTVLLMDLEVHKL